METQNNDIHRQLFALVVDDEPLIRMDAADIIEAAGYVVMEAASGDQAMKILNANDDFSLVFTDIQMPGDINGIDLARQIDERWPSMCVIVSSGATRPKPGVLPDAATFVAKPFSPRKIQDAISETCINSGSHDKKSSH